DYNWAVQRREELEYHYAELLELCVHDYVMNQRYPSAMTLQRILAELYPFNEIIHAQMIALYVFQRRLDEAKAYLAQVQEEIFARELGIDCELNFDQIVSNPSAMFR